VVKVTSWGTKVKEWRPFLLDRARAKIETYLAGSLESDRPTHTM